MQIVILAAGKGVRLGQESHALPKSLVPIYPNTPYLQLQLMALKELQTAPIIIVGGYQINKLQDFLNAQGLPNITLIENKDFHKGNLYSILAAKDNLRDDFFIFNADHYYSAKSYAKILATQSDKFTIVCDQDRSLTDDDMKVYTENHLFKNMSKTLTTFNYGYVGVSYIPNKNIATYWQACEVVATNLGDQANVEAVMNELAKKHQIDMLDISGSWWTEIDTPEDLIKTKNIIKTHSPNR